VQLHLAVVAALDDHNVIDLDLVGLHGIPEVGAHLLGGGQVVVGDGYKVAHWQILLDRGAADPGRYGTADL
jgi:hypothetical protein